MDLKHIAMLALQVSILSIVFGLGLKTTPGDLAYLLRAPGLLLRSLVSMFVVMPVLAVAMVRMFDLSRGTEILLVALAISPVPPILPRKEAMAGGHAAYGLGLLAIAAVLAFGLVPLELELLERYFGRQLSTPPSAIAGLLLKSVLLPLAAGMAVRAVAPGLAARIESPVALIGKVLLPVAALVVLAGAAPAMWARIGDGTALALAVFTLAGLAVGHLLGGPDRHHATVLALSTACRHPAIALTIAATNFRDHDFVPLVLLYLLVNAATGIPYLWWQRRYVTRASTGH